jgi:hypothetical protein
MHKTKTKTKKTQTQMHSLLNSTVSRTSINRFGRNQNVLRSRSPLSDSEIRAVAPSIFAETAHGSRSQKYSYIPTSTVLASLRREGFEPFEVRQGGTRDEEKRAFTKHLIRLRHASQTAQVGDHHHEIVLVNSHDGTSSYQIMSGIFRLVCSNGMVVADDLNEIRIKHSGDVIPQVIDGCIEILGRLPEASESVREWSALRLTEGERAAFGAAALALRYDETEEAPFSAEKLLTVRRFADAEPNLWATLNTVQENVIRGGVSYVLRDENGRRKQMRRTREISGIDQNVRLNRGLWVLAQEMAKLKTA